MTTLRHLLQDTIKLNQLLLDFLNARSEEVRSEYNKTAAKSYINSNMDITTPTEYSYVNVYELNECFLSIQGSVKNMIDICKLISVDVKQTIKYCKLYNTELHAITENQIKINDILQKYKNQPDVFKNYKTLKIYVESIENFHATESFKGFTIFTYFNSLKQDLFSKNNTILNANQDKLTVKSFGSTKKIHKKNNKTIRRQTKRRQTKKRQTNNKKTNNKKTNKKKTKKKRITIQRKTKRRITIL
jgi:hypothetical protein